MLQVLYKNDKLHQALVSLNRVRSATLGMS